MNELRGARRNGTGKHRAQSSRARRVLRYLLIGTAVSLLAWNAGGYVLRSTVYTGRAPVADGLPVAVLHLPADPATSGQVGGTTGAGQPLHGQGSTPPTDGDASTGISGPSEIPVEGSSLQPGGSATPDPLPPAGEVATKEPEPAPAPVTTRPKQTPAPVIEAPVLPRVRVPIDASCSIQNTGGDVRPHVRAVGCALASQFNVSILGRRPTGANANHPDGVAIDIMTGTNSSLGQSIADCAHAHFAKWNLTDIIWNQAISTGGAFRAMEDRGSRTANHKDHVHLSFDRTPANLPPLDLTC